jgi:hypothetical protein
MASKNRRSVNAEVVSRLQASLKWDEYDPASISEMATDIAKLDEQMSGVMDVLRSAGLMR